MRVCDLQQVAYRRQREGEVCVVHGRRRLDPPVLLRLQHRVSSQQTVGLRAPLAALRLRRRCPDVVVRCQEQVDAVSAALLSSDEDGVLACVLLLLSEDEGRDHVLQLRPHEAIATAGDATGSCRISRTQQPVTLLLLPCLVRAQRSDLQVRPDAGVGPAFEQLADVRPVGCCVLVVPDHDLRVRVHAALDPLDLLLVHLPVLDGLVVGGEEEHAH